MTDITLTPKSSRKSRKAFWLKQVIAWHWMSSALCLVGLVLFSVTGFTLNHAADIEAAPDVREHTATVPPAVLPLIAPDDAPDAKKPLPPQVAQWVEREFNVDVDGEAEWSPDTVYLPLPRPGGDAWVSLDRVTGEATSEDSDRGVIAYLNDLHKGRNSGGEWSWFIDVFSFACLVFALTGLVLLWLHAKNRKSTWPLVAGGFVIPAAIAVIFIH